MQAVIHNGFGEPSEVLGLGETPGPEVASGEVLVRVKAAGLSKGDWLITRGWPLIARPSYGIRSPKHPVAGLEFAGVVETTGGDTTRFQAGEAVFGWGSGALADLVAVPEDHLVHKPEGVTFEQAAAVPISGFTALQALRDRGGVRQNDKVLVIGASGGVGHFAVQIAKALGAEVTGVCGTRNVEMVRSLGADHVIDYTRDDIDGAGPFDVIVDIAGNRSLRTLRRSLTPSGTLVIVGSSGGRWTMGFGRTVRAMLTSPFVRHRLRALLSSANQDDLSELARLMDDGRVEPVVGTTYPLAHTTDAIARVGTGGGAGKAVVTI
jgi:NADPH:quinone reductase-like Zn-dependent oxidoreductase